MHLHSVEINVFLLVGTFGKQSFVHLSLSIILLALLDGLKRLFVFFVLRVVSCALVILEKSGVVREQGFSAHESEVLGIALFAL